MPFRGSPSPPPHRDAGTPWTFGNPVCAMWMSAWDGTPAGSSTAGGGTRPATTSTTDAASRRAKSVTALIITSLRGRCASGIVKVTDVLAILY